MQRRIRERAALVTTSNGPPEFHLILLRRYEVFSIVMEEISGTIFKYFFLASFSSTMQLRL